MDVGALWSGGRWSAYPERKAKTSGPEGKFGRRSALLAATLGGVLGFVASVMPAAAQVMVGPAVVDRVIYGQQVQVQFTTALTLATTAAGVQVTATVRGDFSDLQRKFNAIVQTIPLPDNNCPGYGTHTLPKIEAASIEAVGTAAVIKILANATVWQCVRNPVPETVCKMEQRCVDLGPFGRPCTDVPVCSFRDGSPIKTVLVREGFRGELPVTIRTADQVSLTAVPGAPDIQPRGDLGRHLNDLARLFNSDLNTLAGRELDKLVDKAVLSAALPADLKQYDLKIQSASFTSTDGRLGVEATFTGMVGAQQLTGFLQQVLRAQQTRG